MPNVGFKHSEETKAMMRKTHIALKSGDRLPSSKGRKCSPETILKMKEAAKGRIPPSRKGKGRTNFALDEWRANGGRSWNCGLKMLPLSEEHRRKISEALRGDKSPHWAGGKTDLAHKIKKYFKCREWRNLVFKRDNYTCQMCEKRGGRLEAHHIKAFSVIVRERNIITAEEASTCLELWDINNGKTLCRNCHEKTDNYSYKALL